MKTTLSYKDLVLERPDLAQVLVLVDLASDQSEYLTIDDLAHLAGITASHMQVKADYLVAHGYWKLNDGRYQRAMEREQEPVRISPREFILLQSQASSLLSANGPCMFEQMVVATNTELVIELEQKIGDLITEFYRKSLCLERKNAVIDLNIAMVDVVKNRPKSAQEEI